MLKFVLFTFFVCFAIPVWAADVATTTYVDRNVAGRVDTASNANQTMAGTYTVSGTLEVPTPTLPPVE